MTPRARSRRFAVALVVAGSVLAVPTIAAARSEQAKANAVPVIVKSAQTYTDTGLDLRAGDTVTIKAAGRVRFNAVVAAVGPAGIAWGKECNAIAGASRDPWPAPGERCWSLIGRVAGGKPFGIGATGTIRAGRSGRLFLGINDNHVVDNTGEWTVSVSRPGATPPATSAPTSTPAAASKSSSSLVPILAVAGAVVALLLVAVLFVRRRRSGEPSPGDDAAPDVASAPPDAPPDAAAIAAAVTRPRQPSDPFDPTSTDVNIFRVEISTDGLTVRYTFFPEDTIVHWRLVENGATSASGEFVTEGGGSAKHVAELPLGIAVSPGAVDLHFHWVVGEVPFDYSVRREVGS